MATFIEEALETKKFEGSHTTSAGAPDTVNRYTVPANRYARVVAFVKEGTFGSAESTSNISLLINDTNVLSSVRDDSSRIPSQVDRGVFYVEPGDVIKTVATRAGVFETGGGRFYIHVTEFGKP